MGKRKSKSKNKGRSVSMMNRLAKKKKKTFFMPAKKQKRLRDKDVGFKTLKSIGFVILALAIGSVILAKYTGANKIERGDLEQGEVCQVNTDCASGHVCFAYKDNPKQCLQKCSESTDCLPDLSCEPVVRVKKKNLNPMRVCVQK